MNKIKKLFFILLLTFFIINVIIVILWPIKTSLKFSNFEPYTKEVLQVLDLNKADSLKLYLETWQRERIFEYDQFTGLTESETTNFKFVNISKENGRLVSNNKNNCTNNIFFYGGETMFGYDVTDYQTIPFYFKEKANRTVQLSRKVTKVTKTNKILSFCIFLMIYGVFQIEMICSNSFRTINSLKTRSLLPRLADFNGCVSFDSTRVRCRFDWIFWKSRSGLQGDLKGSYITCPLRIYI